MHIPRRPLTGSSQAVRLRETLCGLRGFEHCSKHPRGVTCPACAGLLRNRLLPADPDPSPGTRCAGNPTSLKPPRTRTRRGRPCTVRSPASASGREVRDEPESPVRRRTRGPRSSGACARRSTGSSTTSDRGRSWHSPRRRSSTSTSRRRGAAVRGPALPEFELSRGFRRNVVREWVDRVPSTLSKAIADLLSAAHHRVTARRRLPLHRQRAHDLMQRPGRHGGVMGALGERVRRPSPQRRARPKARTPSLVEAGRSSASANAFEIRRWGGSACWPGPRCHVELDLLPLRERAETVRPDRG